MFSRFNLILEDELNVDVVCIEKIHEKYKKNVEQALEKYICEEGKIDGAALQSEWFPDVKADIFISHSHNDRDKAVKLAALLYENFGLVSFIDSFVWGSADKLLKKIDEKYCKQESGYYDYEKRNFSTSHVHMMLSVALGKVIDKCECVIFLNTANSVSTSSDVIINKTNSPWIYSEICMSNIMKKTPPKRYSYETKSYNQIQENYNIIIEHILELSNFIDINKLHINQWIREHNKNYHPLDTLYSIINLES